MWTCIYVDFLVDRKEIKYKLLYIKAMLLYYMQTALFYYILMFLNGSFLFFLRNQVKAGII